VLIYAVHARRFWSWNLSISSSELNEDSGLVQMGRFQPVSTERRNPFSNSGVFSR